jgi:protocatechuate 3,4-dioxygenase beta subunit
MFGVGCRPSTGGPRHDGGVRAPRTPAAGGDPLDRVGRVGRVDRLDRRQALRWLGVTALAVAGAACSAGSGATGLAAGTTTTVNDRLVADGTTSTTAPGATTTTLPDDLVDDGSGSTSTTAAPTCTATPAMTDGPYYLPNEPRRRDVTEGRPGVPLVLAVHVASAPACAAVPEATVEIWQADAGGAYSGFGAAAANRTFLRGAQVTDSAGNVVFDTIYPGWYPGRATHIHLKVHQQSATLTTQLFFDESVTDAVYALAPYDAHAGQRTSNARDSVFAGGGTATMVALTPSADGYVGSVTIAVPA